MGSVAVDAEFERLLRNIFGDDFIDTFRRKRPAGAVSCAFVFHRNPNFKKNL